MNLKLFTIITIMLIIVACQPNIPEVSKLKIINPEDLIGKTIEYKYGESIYHVTIDSKSGLHWEAMTGEEKGAFEEEIYIIESIDNQKLFITWGEANGIGVAQVLDFEKGVVYNHLLRGRDVSMGKGAIRILE